VTRCEHTGSQLSSQNPDSACGASLVNQAADKGSQRTDKSRRKQGFDS
jgi:hypothetical protein